MVSAKTDSVCSIGSRYDEFPGKQTFSKLQSILVTCLDSPKAKVDFLRSTTDFF